MRGDVGLEVTPASPPATDLYQIKPTIAPRQASQAFLWVLLLKGSELAPPGSVSAWLSASQTSRRCALLMPVARSCLSRRNGNSQTNLQVQFCN